MDQLNLEITKIVRSPDFAQATAAHGAVAIRGGPAEFDAVIRGDVAKRVRSPERRGSIADEENCKR